MLDIASYAKAEGIPYKYWLADSWWYYKGEGGGVKTWAPRPDIFPSGLAAFVRTTGWRTQLHNRYWANDTTYARQNGGAYDFHVETENKLALPASQRFWDELRNLRDSGVALINRSCTSFLTARLSVKLWYSHTCVEGT